MKDNGIVEGTQNLMPKEKEYSKDTIYIRDNIQEIPPTEKGGRTMYKYNEKQYSLSEYMAILDAQLEIQKQTQAEQDEMIYNNTYELATLKLEGGK